MIININYIRHLRSTLHVLEVLSLLNQYPQIDGIEGRLSTDTSPTYFYKQEKSILIYYLMYRNGDLMRQIQFGTADPTPCQDGNLLS